MRLLLLCFLFVLVGCGSSDSDGNGRQYDYYVDALNGSDENPGTRDLPFSTISHAVDVVEDNASIRVFPGLYDQSHGEDDVIPLDRGIELIGDENNLGLGTPPTQLGSTVRVGDNSLIAGFNIVPTGTDAVRVRDAATIRNNTIDDTGEVTAMEFNVDTFYGANTVTIDGDGNIYFVQPTSGEGSTGRRIVKYVRQ